MLLSIFLFTACSALVNLGKDKDNSRASHCTIDKTSSVVDKFDASNTEGETYLRALKGIGGPAILAWGGTGNQWITRISRDSGLTWETADTVSGATPDELIEDHEGHIIQIGRVSYDATTSKALVRISSDFGKTWASIDPLDGSDNLKYFPVSTSSHYDALSKTVFMSFAGDAPDTIIRKSNDFGRSWKTSDRVPSNTWVTYFSGNDGALYYSARNYENGNRILVKKSTDHGTTWQPLAEPSGSNLFPAAFFQNSQNDLFLLMDGDQVSGTQYTPETSVLRYDKANGSFAPVSSTIHTGMEVCGGRSPFVSSDGTIYVSGYCRKESNYSYFLLEGLEGGTKWNNHFKDEFMSQLLPHPNSQFVILATNFNGKGSSIYTTRDPASVWDLQFKNESYENLRGATSTIDDSGAIYVGATHFGSRDNGWVIKKLSCN